MEHTARGHAPDSAEAVRVLLVEDQPEFRDLLAILLGRSGDYRVQAADVTCWLDDVRASEPDVLLLDLTLDGIDATPSIPKVVADCPTTMVAALTGNLAEDREQTTLAAGAFVFYEKTWMSRLPEYLPADLALFRRALAGEDVLAPSATTRRLSTGAPVPEDAGQRQL